MKRNVGYLQAGYLVLTIRSRIPAPGYPIPDTRSRIPDSVFLCGYTHLYRSVYPSVNPPCNRC